MRIHLLWSHLGWNYFTFQTTWFRSSIPVEKGEVKLDYDVTSYESKLGDPKPEEPTIQGPRVPVEPEKIKAVEPSQVGCHSKTTIL